MTIIQGLYDFFLTCPVLQNGALHVNWLPPSVQDGLQFSIDASPADEAVATHLRGGGVCRFEFVLRSINAFGPDTLQNIENNGLYDTLAAWLRTQTAARRLPSMPPGMQPLRIAALSAGYLFQEDSHAGHYQIQCRLEYYRKGVLL